MSSLFQNNGRVSSRLLSDACFRRSLGRRKELKESNRQGQRFNAIFCYSPGHPSSDDLIRSFMWRTRQCNTHVQPRGTAGTSVDTLEAAPFSCLSFSLSLEKSHSPSCSSHALGSKMELNKQRKHSSYSSRRGWGRNHCHRKEATQTSELFTTQLGRLEGFWV